MAVKKQIRGDESDSSAHTRCKCPESVSDATADTKRQVEDISDSICCQENCLWHGDHFFKTMTNCSKWLEKNMILSANAQNQQQWSDLSENFTHNKSQNYFLSLSITSWKGRWAANNDIIIISHQQRELHPSSFYTAFITPPPNTNTTTHTHTHTFDPPPKLFVMKSNTWKRRSGRTTCASNCSAFADTRERRERRKGGTGGGIKAAHENTRGRTHAKTEKKRRKECKPLNDILRWKRVHKTF